MKNPDSNRIFGLDVMRATAILTVVYAHAYSLIEHKYPGLSHINIEGVTLFFVLSGYLIGRILINDSQKKGCNSSTLLVFWSRRWLRTLPAYFFVLIILIIFSVTLEHALPSNIWLYFVFSQNIAWSHPEFFGEAWSLAVEEWFYISVPLVLFFIVYSTKTSVSRATLIISIAVILGSIAIRAARLQVGDIHSTSEWDLALRKIVVMRLDSLMFGVLGAYFSVFVNSWWNKIRKPAFIFGVCLLSIDVVMQNRLLWRDYITLTATPLAALCLLPLLSSWKNCPHPFFKVINFVSLISYSLYLVNFSLVKYILLDLYIDNAPGYFSKTAVIYITYWIMNIVIAYFIWRFVEKPFLKLRERSYRIKHFQTESN